jgi:hypothetical protein
MISQVQHFFILRVFSLKAKVHTPKKYRNMGCGNAKNASRPAVTPNLSSQPPAPQPNSNSSLPQSQSLPKPDPQRPGPKPEPSAPRPPPYSFPEHYTPDSHFQLQVKDLTGALDFPLDLQPKLTGREFFQLIGAELKKLGEQREFQVVLYGRAIKCDEEEIGKSGLSVKGVAYCIFKPNN